MTAASLFTLTNAVTSADAPMASAESTSRLAWQIDGLAFDIAIVCAGVYGPRSGGLQPVPS